MLGEAHDRRARAGLELGERRQIRILGLLHRRVDRPPVRAALGAAQAPVDPFNHLVRERVAELVRVHVCLGGRVPHEVGQEPLDDPVLPDDPLRSHTPARSQERLLARAALDQALGLEPLQHLAGRRARHAEHLGHSGRERQRPARRRVLPDREREEVDRLEVLVDRVALRQTVTSVPKTRSPS